MIKICFIDFKNIFAEISILFYDAIFIRHRFGVVLSCDFLENFYPEIFNRSYC